MTRVHSTARPNRLTRPNRPARPKRPSQSRRLALGMPYAQFLAEWNEPTHVEWVEGEVVEMGPISGNHNTLANYLIFLFIAFLEENDIGKIRTDPFQMKTGPDLPGRAPDIIFVAKRNLRRLHNTYLDGPADLVVEIISPGSVTIDRVDKFQEYEAGGVRQVPGSLTPITKPPSSTAAVVTDALGSCLSAPTSSFGARHFEASGSTLTGSGIARL